MSLTDEQVAERHTGLGGSDAAPALGLSPYKTPLELFLDKRERRVSADLSIFRWGHLLEPVIRQEYSNLTRRVVRQPPGTMRHPKHGFMLAHFDGVTEDGRIFEAKTARSADGWGRSGTDEVPQHYIIQVQHYMAVSGLQLADIAVLIGGSDFRVFEVPADLQLQAEIIEGEAQFWQHVERGAPPPPDWDADLSALLTRLYPGTNGRTLTASPIDDHYRQTYEHALNAAQTYQRVADGAKQHLLYQMGEASRLTFADGVQLTRKLVARKAYSVPATDYIDSRFSRSKETA